MSSNCDPFISASTLVRYVSNLEIRIAPRGSSQDGLIYPPLITVDYANLYADSDYGIGKLVKVRC